VPFSRSSGYDVYQGACHSHAASLWLTSKSRIYSPTQQAFKRGCYGDEADKNDSTITSASPIHYCAPDSLSAQLSTR